MNNNKQFLNGAEYDVKYQIQIEGSINHQGRKAQADNGSSHHTFTTLREEATFSLQELACEKQPLPTTVQFSIVHARNSSRNSHAKLIVRSVVKWREFRGNKKIALTLICYARFTQDSRNALNRSRTGKNQFFKIYSSRFLDGFERLSAEATFRTPANTAKMQPLLAGYTFTKAKFNHCFIKFIQSIILSSQQLYLLVDFL